MSEKLLPGSKVAVIGGGVAGLVSAYLLQQKYDVTLYESASRLGGHTNTVTIPSGPDAGTKVDTGFIVLNDQNYPHFTTFLQKLNVPVRYSDMSFSYECRQTGFSYAGTTFNGLFAQRRNVFSPAFYGFLAEVARFASDGRSFLASEDGYVSLTLGEFLARGRYSRQMQESFVLPMGAAIWSAPTEEIMQFPARSILRFFANHGLLSIRNRPRWQTVVGGSSEYIKAFTASFSGTIRLSSPVESISAEARGVSVAVRGEAPEHYDACVIGAHADQALRMLADPDTLERELLGAWRYQPNRTILHTDVTHLPRSRRAWASWNYAREKNTAGTSPVSVTYHMNRLQGLNVSEEYCVSLNPVLPIDPKRIIAELLYEHPMYDSASVGTQPRLSELQGRNGRYYCGSYFGHGFHEDAVRSAITVGKLLGVSL